MFIRTGRPKVPIVYGADQKFEIGKAIEVVEGSDVAIVANGLLVAQAILAAETLEGEGISARVIDMHTVKPLDREAIRRAAAETGAIVVAEEHLVDGGLGVRVAQVVAETAPCPMEFVGIHDTYAESGQPDELLEKYGLVARDVAAAVRKVVARKALAGRPMSDAECLAEAFLEQSPACHWVVTADGVFHRIYGDPPPSSGNRPPSWRGARPPKPSLPSLPVCGGTASPAPSKAKPWFCASAAATPSGTSPCSPSASAGRSATPAGWPAKSPPGAPPNRNCATPCWAPSRPRSSSATWSPGSCTTPWART